MSLLSRLFEGSRNPRAEVARRWTREAGADQIICWGQFRADVDRLINRLETSPKGGWVLLTEDAYAFAVGLLALWHSDRFAISPPNRQTGALRVLQSEAAGVLTDLPDLFSKGHSGAPVLYVENSAESAIDSPALPALDPDSLAVEFYTSGTTGDAKPVRKNLRHLETEVEELGALWDRTSADATIFSSASHQHLYGMLFGVLWPLASGHVFQARHFLHAGELIPRLQSVDRSVLVSVPTHLKRFAAHSQTPELKERCCAIFSSGGPLAHETAHRIEEILGAAPIEIFGSTETGGIAWRQQGVAEAKPLWTPFGSVQIARDETSCTLRVRSPFVSVADENSFLTADRIVLHDENQFELLRRADRVVKIGERRLDLTQMESHLRDHAAVEDLALTTIARELDERGTERVDSTERVAAVIVPSENGWASIRESGRRAMTSQLRHHLAESWDPILHPRYWRVVVQLPEDPQGKITQNNLRALFQEPNWGPLKTDRPEYLGEVRTDDSIERYCLVPFDLSCFPGHFPTRLVVPGVLQLDWALALAEVWLGHAPPVTVIERLKLLQPLEPGARFTIRVERPSPTRLDFKIWHGDEVFAKSKIQIGPERE